jgi:hypothetical protein
MTPIIKKEWLLSNDCQMVDIREAVRENSFPF